MSYICDVMGRSFMNKQFWETDCQAKFICLFYSRWKKIIKLKISVELGKPTLESIQTFLSFLLSFLLLIFTQGGCHKLFRSPGCPCWPGTLLVLQQSSRPASIAIGHTAFWEAAAGSGSALLDSAAAYAGRRGTHH